jgi:O-antigen/teichoic acid export membrane protein
MSVREAWSRGTRAVRGPRAREFALFAGSTVLFQAARFVFSLAAARALLPVDFTGWALTVALLVYAPSLLLGVVNGMGRELPILIGRGGGEAADRAVGAAWSATLVGAIVILVAAAAVAAAAPAASSSPMLVGLLAAGTITYGTQQFILRSRLRFDAASAQQALFGVIAVVSAAILAFHPDADFGTAAALYGVPLALAVAVGVAVAPPPFPPRLVLDEVRRLAGIGLPIMLAGLVFSVFVTLDRWVAVTLLGPQRAAPYALASLIAAAMLVVPTVVSQQTYPRMAIARGRGAVAPDLRSMARHQGLLAATLVAPVAVAVALFAWIAVPVLLPDYAAAAPAAVILSLGFIVLGYLTGYGNYLNVVGGQWRYLAAQLVGVAVAVVLMFAGGGLAGLLGIAIGMAISHVVYGVVLRAVALRTGLVDDPPAPGATRG